MTKFTVYNLTDSVIETSTSGLLDLKGATKEGPSTAQHASVLVQPNNACAVSKVVGKHLFLHTTDGEGALRTSKVSVPGLWAKRGASWKVVKITSTSPGYRTSGRGSGEEESPWRAYWLWSSKSLVVVPRRNMASFLSDMPDSLSLASLVLPGTHDTMAFYGWPISQCQSTSTPLSTQFLDGIRVIDVRLAVVPIIPPSPGRAHSKAIRFPPGHMAEAQSAAGTVLPTPEYKLLAYHGIYPQRTPFTEILASIHAFLTSPAGRRETIVMSIKQEDFTLSPPTLFSRLVREEIQRSPGGFSDTDSKGNRDLGMWFLENRIPTLGEARGKCVLLSRFGVEGKEWEGGWEGMGIHPLRWPDSEKRGFVWQLKGVRIRTHDWYAIPSFLAIPEKTVLATRVMDSEVVVPLQLPVPEDASASATLGEKVEVEEMDEKPTLNITYLSAATFPLALPPIVAKGFGWPGFSFGFEGVNARVGKWLLEQLAPDVKTSPSPAPVRADYGAVKQERANDDKRVNERREKMRWFRPKLPRTNSSRALLRREEGEGTKADLPHVEQTRGVDALAASTRLSGWALLDYYSSERDLVPLLVEFNYRGRRSGLDS